MLLSLHRPASLRDLHRRLKKLRESDSHRDESLELFPALFPAHIASLCKRTDRARIGEDDVVAARVQNAAAVERVWCSRA